VQEDSEDNIAAFNNGGTQRSGDPEDEMILSLKTVLNSLPEANEDDDGDNTPRSLTVSLPESYPITVRRYAPQPVNRHPANLDKNHVFLSDASQEQALEVSFHSLPTRRHLIPNAFAVGCSRRAADK